MRRREFSGEIFLMDKFPLRSLALGGGGRKEPRKVRGRGGNKVFFFGETHREKESSVLTTKSTTKK